MKATQEQVGGSHYKDMPIQPVEFIHKNGIPFIEGCVIKYVSRWRNKGGVEDLKKAGHFLDLLIEMEEAKETIDPLYGGEDYTSTQRAWPEKYEVGMKFRRKDGAIQTCVWASDQFSYITAPEGWSYEHASRGRIKVWSYAQGAKENNWCDEFPESTLVEYLGKD